MTASARDLIPPPGPPNPPEEWYKEREESSPVIPPGVTPFLYTDCNHNGVADRSESFPDCDGNGIIDWCQIEADPSLDCDEDGLLDACLMSVNPGFDCNANGIFDLCEPQFQLPDYPLDPPQGALPDDCNANRISDELEICRNPLIDCNGDGLLDLCQTLADPSLDCDGNGVLDFCEINSRTDCDGNGILDRCENPCDIGLGGPRYLGDGDWGRWTWIEEAGCKVVVTVHSGPIKIKGQGSGYVDVEADPMSPGDEQPAMLRAVMTCGGNCSVGSECFIDVPLTVQAYAVLKVEARAFIPCGAAGLPDAQLFIDAETGLPNQVLAQFAIVGKGDCRDFDCSVPLPTNGVTLSSRVVVATAGSMRFLSIWGCYSMKAASELAAMQLVAPPQNWSSCSGPSGQILETVPNTDWRNNCDWIVSSFQPPCPLPLGYLPPCPTVADLSVGATPAGTQFVGTGRYKKVLLSIEEGSTCPLPLGMPVPTISFVGELGLWQRCDPAGGMSAVWYDLLGAHDKFPAYELDVEFEPPTGSPSGDCLYLCPPLGSLADLVTVSLPEVPFANGVHFDVLLRPGMLNYAAYSINYQLLRPTSPWRVLP